MGCRTHTPPSPGSAHRGLLSPRKPWGVVRPGQAHCGSPGSRRPHSRLHTPPSPRFPGLGHTNTLLTLQHPQHGAWGGPRGPPGPSPGQPCVLLLQGGNLCPPPQGHSWPTPSGDTASAESGDSPAPVNPPMAPSSPPPGVAGDRGAGTHVSPQPSSGCRGRALERRPGGRPERKGGSSCPLYHSRWGSPRPLRRGRVARGLLQRLPAALCLWLLGAVGLRRPS